MPGYIWIEVSGKAQSVWALHFENSRPGEPVTKGYVDQLGAFRYKGRIVEAHVVREGKGPRTERTPGTWTLRIGKDEFAVFPASPADTEGEVRERIKQWLDEHLPG